MNNIQLKSLSNLIAESEESIEVSWQEECLTLKTEKYEWWIFLGIALALFSSLLIYAHDRGAYNLEIGLIGLYMSLQTIWSKFTINKTILFNPTENTIIIKPAFFLQRFWLAKYLQISQPMKLHELEEIKVVHYRNFQYHWTRRVYFTRKHCSVYLLEFEDKDTAKAVAEVINRMRQQQHITIKLNVT
ncbi:hypothetical protein GXP67_23480 [Rhodocytophaga rosea]|uniref:Uncharacterized protein n=1 Tax=Rhodocytophaga rosea TaxID=2704465 RepID=A0A6C0GMY9_9BACT|nr:hypothetical protein [Rhodocytophaga rosea]QHT69389.1 hypothetical protein GXP67_23480 [Rhodocytophaga rosea]